MENFVNERIIGGLLGHNAQTWPMTPYVHLAAMVVAALIVGSLAMTYAGIVTWLFRRIAGRIQSRIGCNRVGPLGFLQWLADAVKMLTKEDLIPRDADHVLFRMSAYFVFAGFLLTFVVIPLSPHIVVADMSIGIFYVVAVTALVVVGLLMGSWAANSKWALFGGIRSAAQIVSYEIPAGLSLLVPILMAGTLSTQGLIRAQGGVEGGSFLEVGGWPWNWTLFASPMAFVAFFIFMTSLLAEGNRVPFDLPEAESELVAGYNTEFSGMRFGVFFLVEFGNNFVMGALASILFLGGWQVPGVTEAQLKASVALEVLGGALFLLKVVAVTFGVIWVGWTMPRIRVDQMMSLCWKYLVPIAMVLVVLAAASEWIFAGVSATAGELFRVAFFVAAGAVPLALFLKQTFKNIRLAGDKVDLSNW